MTSGSDNCHSALALKEQLPAPQTVRAGRGVRRYSFRFPPARVPERQRSASVLPAETVPDARRDATGSRLRRRYAAEPDARQAYNAVDIVNRLDIEPLAIYWRSYGVHMRYTCERGSRAPDRAVARPGREGQGAAAVRRSRSGTVYRRGRGCRTRDSRNIFFRLVTRNRHASSRAAVQDRERCTHPTARRRRRDPRDERRGSNHTALAVIEYRIPRTLGEFAAFSAAFEPSCRWVYSARPRALVPSPAHTHLRSTRKRQHHGSHHSAPICGPLPCSHLLQRSHQECDGVIGLLLSERVDRRIQLRGEAVLGEVLKHPRGAPCWSRGCGSR